jgi:hypothetical protein
VDVVIRFSPACRVLEPVSRVLDVGTCLALQLVEFPSYFPEVVVESVDLRASGPRLLVSLNVSPVTEKFTVKRHTKT